MDSQLDALRAAGVDQRQIYVETASGARDDRPVLSELVEQVQDGDTIVVAKLDRLGRSVAHLVELTTRLDGRGVALQSLSEQIDTSTAAGRFMVHMLAALAQMERLGRRLRARLLPQLLAAADAHGVTIAANAATATLAARYCAEVPGLADVGEAWPRGRRLHRPPRPSAKMEHDNQEAS